MCPLWGGNPFAASREALLLRKLLFGGATRVQAAMATGSKVAGQAEWTEATGLDQTLTPIHQSGRGLAILAHPAERRVGYAERDVAVESRRAEARAIGSFTTTLRYIALVDKMKKVAEDVQVPAFLNAARA